MLQRARDFPATVVSDSPEPQSCVILLSHSRRDSPSPPVAATSHHHQSPPRVISTNRSSASLPLVAHQIHYRQPIAHNSLEPQSPRVLLHELRESSPPVAVTSHHHRESSPPVVAVIHCHQSLTRYITANYSSDSLPPVAQDNVIDLEIIERIGLFKSRDFKVSGNPCEIKLDINRLTIKCDIFTVVVNLERFMGQIIA
ncbi:Uncharacterized protein Fot_28522 [Forsythia ovata]|uniref:Uncharacterized protein n=1 Tax=Forsythia ovata TaxID=205694 RepID=A0ABD1TPA1_9LAMI